MRVHMCFLVPGSGDTTVPFREPSWPILRHLGRRLGLSSTVLEPSCTILDALTHRGPGIQTPGDEVGGRVRGKRGVGRGSSLDHLRGEGWWDLAGVAARPLKAARPHTRACERCLRRPTSKTIRSWWRCACTLRRIEDVLKTPPAARKRHAHYITPRRRSHPHPSSCIIAYRRHYRRHRAYVRIP